MLDHRGPPQFGYGNSIVDSSPFQKKGGVLVIRSYDGISPMKSRLPIPTPRLRRML